MFFFLICFCFAATGDQVRAHFFDVGQGHCFLFVMKNAGFGNPSSISDPADVAILIDAGSTTVPKADIIAQSLKIDSQGSIRRKIKKYINETSIKVLIISTHGDIDHYNWLKKFFILHDDTHSPQKKSLRTENNKVRISAANTLCILGGQIDDYKNSHGSSELPDFITADPNFKVNSNSSSNWFFVKAFIDVFSINSKINAHLNTHEISVTILSALCDNMDTNKSSIVVRIAYQPNSHHEISFMIPGDAPGSITDTIVANHSTNSAALKSTVLLASHHGATTDGANNQAWFNAVNPQYVVFSHGDNKGFLHPHPSAVHYALEETEKHPPDLLKENHDLFYGQCVEDYNLVPTQHASTFAQLTSGYRTMCTSSRVLSTYNQGDIEFTIKRVGSTLKMDVFWNKKVAIGTVKDEKIVETYMNGKIAKEISHLFFINQQEIAKWFFSTFIRRMFSQSQSLAFLPSLTYMDVQIKLKNLISPTTSGSMSDSDPIPYLVEFIRANRSIRDLKVMSSDFSDSDSQSNLKDAWNNRGITFIHDAIAH